MRAGLPATVGARRHVPGDDAAGADDRAVADGDARKDDGGGADPGVAADAHRLGELEAGVAQRLLARMVGGDELNARPDLRLVADDDLADVEDDAVEVEEGAGAEADVVAVVAVERRADDRPVADRGETLDEQPPPLGARGGEAGIVADQPRLRGLLVGLNFRIGRIVERPSQHLLFFRGHVAAQKQTRPGPSPEQFRPEPGR